MLEQKFGLVQDFEGGEQCFPFSVKNRWILSGVLFFVEKLGLSEKTDALKCP